MLSVHFNDIRPPGGIVRTLEVMFDSVGEMARLPLAIFLRILLRSEDDRFSAFYAVDLVDSRVNLPHLLIVGSMEVDEVRLNGVVGTKIHDEHPSAFVLKTSDIGTFEAVDGSVDDGLCAVRRGEQSFGFVHAILRQIVAETVRVDEDTHKARHAVLLPELGGASRCIVGHMRADIVQLREHVGKRS